MALLGTRSAAGAPATLAAGRKLVMLGRMAAVGAVRVGRRGVKVVNVLLGAAKVSFGESGSEGDAGAHLDV